MKIIKYYKNMDMNEKLLQIIIETEGYGGRPSYTIYYSDKKGEPKRVLLPIGEWNKGAIINSLIRNVYSQDQVEAIINNHFLNIAEWLDKKFNNENVSFEDKDYDELQRWRKQCKVIAEEALSQYPPLN